DGIRDCHVTGVQTCALPILAGWSVLTRPPSISGAPVTSSTDVTSMPASRNARAVPPEETISTPARTRRLAKGTRPSLSYTETRRSEARRAGTDSEAPGRRYH